MTARDTIVLTLCLALLFLIAGCTGYFLVDKNNFFFIAMINMAAACFILVIGFWAVLRFGTEKGTNPWDNRLY